MKGVKYVKLIQVLPFLSDSCVMQRFMSDFKGHTLPSQEPHF